MAQQIGDRHNQSRQLKVNEDGSIDINTLNDGQIISSTNPLPVYNIKQNTNDIEEASSTITYIGTENKNGNWLVKKINTSSGASFSYATINNNSSYLTYDTAWTARAGLTYEKYGDAF